MARRPAELPDLRGIHRVTAVVAGPVGHGPDERVRPGGEAQDFPREDDVLHLVAAADVVDLAVASPAEHEVDGRAVVQHVEPVAHVAAVAVERQGRVVERVGDEEGHDLLRILVRPEVVRRARDHDRHAVRVPVGEREEIATRLRRRVGIRWVQRVLLGRGAVRDTAVDLVGADVQQARDLEVAHRLQQREHARDVGPQELVGLDERAIDVRAGREIDDGVDAAGGVAHALGIADVAVHEGVARIALDVGEVGGIARVRELVEVDEAVVRMRVQDVTDEVAADEARTACHQKLHG